MVGTQRFQVTVAKTPDDYHTGLMHRQRLKKYEGMWFPFQPAHPVAFWMKNCLIPLDFIYIRNAKIVEILPDRPPCTIEGETCPSYPSHGDVDAVLEVTGGTAVKYRWQPGLIILLKNKN